MRQTKRILFVREEKKSERIRRITNKLIKARTKVKIITVSIIFITPQSSERAVVYNNYCPDFVYKKVVEVSP